MIKEFFQNNLQFRNNKVIYYIKGVISFITPRFVLDREIKSIYKMLDKYDRTEINERVNYYNKQSDTLNPDLFRQNIFCHDKNCVTTEYILSQQDLGFDRIYSVETSSGEGGGKITLSEYKKSWSKYASSYFLDLYDITKYFPQNLKIIFRFGDITDVKYPAITKSRPLNVDNSNNILLKLNKSRHFVFVKDKKHFHKKKIY